MIINESLKVFKLINFNKEYWRTFKLIKFYVKYFIYLFFKLIYQKTRSKLGSIFFLLIAWISWKFETTIVNNLPLEELEKFLLNLRKILLITINK